MTTQRTPDSATGKVIRRNIDTILAAKEMMPKELYSALGMAASSYSLMFKNAGGPKTRALMRIAKALGVSIAELTK
ncbi:hypothetical protein LCGC14_0258500 [marine sediment metagenome]|uniref:HTH cro/C1-type domain-containing protein n=1 Tax=marine sediment metagenome TaxID=412755 RepID=A0A0F9U2D3_9ZZZZ